MGLRRALYAVQFEPRLGNGVWYDGISTSENGVYDGADVVGSGVPNAMPRRVALGQYSLLLIASN